MLLDGERVLACPTLAAQAQGRAVTTIDGVAAVARVNEGRASNDAEIREYKSGNLCRCAAYPNIVAGVRQAEPRMRRA